MRISAVTRCSAAACFVFAAALPAAPAFTLEQILGSPFPGGLVAQPGGDAVAWVSDAAGVRNVWVARSPDFRPVKVTAFTSDDGQEIAGIDWKPDGSQLAFTRGGANPLSDPSGPHREIWLASETGRPHKLADGYSPSFAPDGSAVAWIAQGQIWLASTAPGRPPGKPAQLIDARGEARELAWSPDSALLAFSSGRGDHAFIGVYRLKEKSLVFPDASVDSDRSPAWSPDGSQLAFIRVPAFHDETGWGQSPKPEGQPWSIRILDLRKGATRELWRADAGPGSVFWPMTASRQLLWTADGTKAGRILFPWERDGWLHLYAIAVSGGSPALLTPGNFEIADAALTAGRDSAIVSSNRNDPDRRHLWLVPLNGDSPRLLTPGRGIEWSPAALSSGRIAMIHSDARMPANVALLADGQVRDLVPLSPSFPSQDLVEPKPVVFLSPDGHSVHSQLFLPLAQGRRPAVIFFHGGPRRQMLLGWHPMQYYHQAYGFNEYLAAEGYVVLSVNYRSGTGYGTGFREVPRYGATGAAEYADVLGAAEYLRTRGDVDPKRIGLWGGSYGGYLTALGLARNSDLFAAGVDFHGIHDWNLEFPGDLTRSPEAVRTAFDSSPLAAIATWRSPVLIVQGDDDRDVAFSQSVRVIEALRRQGVPFGQLILPDEVHEFLVHSHWLEVYRAADAFLAKYLKP